MTTRLALSDLLPNTNYVIRVRAVNASGTSEWSAAVPFTTITDTVLPNTPASPTWVVVGDSFHGEWNAVSTNVNGNAIVISRYEVQLTAGATTRIVAVPPSTGDKLTFDLSFEANKSLFGTPQPSISFQVRAVSTLELKSAWTLPALTANNAVPSTPANFTATAATDSVRLSWSAATDDDTVSYVLYNGNTSGFTPSSSNAIWSGTALSFTYTTTTYSAQYFKLVAIDRFGQSSIAATAGPVTPVSPFAVDTTAPNTPTALTATITNNANGIGASAAVSWTMTSPPSDLAGYYVRYRPVGATNYSQVTFAKDALAGTIALDQAYTNYEFQIKAFDWSNNESAWSATTTATSPSAGTPAQITGVTARPSSNSISYSWTPSPEKNVTNYQADFSTDSTFATGVITFNTGSSPALTVNGLNPSTSYSMRVRAVNSAGTSSTNSATNTTSTTAAGGVTTVSADIITPGTLGTAGSGVINIGAGASLVTNGGYIKSNTYTGTAQASNPSGAGFYLGNDGLRIDSGIINAGALVTGTISGTNTITLSGANAKIVGGSWSLSGSGLSIPNGGIAAAALNIQPAGANLVPPAFADFESNPLFFLTATGRANNVTASSFTNIALSIDTTTKWNNQQSLKVVKTDTSTPTIILSPATTTDNINLTNAPTSTTYIVSYYVYPTVTTALTAKLMNGTTQIGSAASGTLTANTWQRKSFTVTTTLATAHIEFVLPNVAGTWYFDGLQVEQQMTNASTPSPWTPPGSTSIAGELIRTGAITSNSKALVWDSTTSTYVTDPTGQPAWDIDLNGDAEFADVKIRGALVIGEPYAAQDFVNDPQFASGTDAFVGVTLNASDTLAGTLPDGATTYGKATGTNDWASGIAITTVVGHTYRIQCDMRLATGGSTSGTAFGLLFWYLTTDGAASNTSSTGGIMTGPTAANSNAAWTHVTYDWTATSGMPIVHPAIAAGSNQWLVTNFSVTDLTAAQNNMSTASSGNYEPGQTGWTIRSDGFAEFRNVASQSLGADALAAGTLQDDVVIALHGTIEASSADGSIRVGMSKDGFYSTGPDPLNPGQSMYFINFPTATGKPNIISGVLDATTLSVHGDSDGNAASFYGTNTINPEASLVLSASVGAPASAPQVSSSLEQYTFKVDANADGYSYNGPTIGHDGNAVIAERRTVSAANESYNQGTAHITTSGNVDTYLYLQVRNPTTGALVGTHQVLIMRTSETLTSTNNFSGNAVKDVWALTYHNNGVTYVPNFLGAGLGAYVLVYQVTGTYKSYFNNSLSTNDTYNTIKAIVLDTSWNIVSNGDYSTPVSGTQDFADDNWGQPLISVSDAVNVSTNYDSINSRPVIAYMHSGNNTYITTNFTWNSSTSKLVTGTAVTWPAAQFNNGNNCRFVGYGTYDLPAARYVFLDNEAGIFRTMDPTSTASIHSEEQWTVTATNGICGGYWNSSTGKFESWFTDGVSKLTRYIYEGGLMYWTYMDPVFGSLQTTWTFKYTFWDDTGTNYETAASPTSSSLYFAKRRRLTAQIANIPTSALTNSPTKARIYATGPLGTGFTSTYGYVGAVAAPGRSFQMDGTITGYGAGPGSFPLFPAATSPGQILGTGMFIKGDGTAQLSSLTVTNNLTLNGNLVLTGAITRSYTTYHRFTSTATPTVTTTPATLTGWSGTSITGSCFSSFTGGTLTCSVAGTYLVTARIGWSSESDFSNRLQLRVIKNNSQWVQNDLTPPSASRNLAQEITWTVQLAIGDTLAVQVAATGTAPVLSSANVGSSDGSHEWVVYRVGD